MDGWMDGESHLMAKRLSKFHPPSGEEGQLPESIQDAAAAQQAELPAPPYICGPTLLELWRGQFFGGSGEQFMKQMDQWMMVTAVGYI